MASACPDALPQKHHRVSGASDPRFQCPICWNLKLVAVTLPGCGHSLCYECAFHWACTKDDPAPLRCPTCRADAPPSLTASSGLHRWTHCPDVSDWIDRFASSRPTEEDINIMENEKENSSPKIEILPLLEEEWMSLIHTGNLELVKQFVAAGVDPKRHDDTSRNCTALLPAVGDNHREIVEYLLFSKDCGLDVNDPGNTGITPLFNCGDPATGSLLLFAGADVNFRARRDFPRLGIRKGDSVLHTYVRRHAWDMLEFLLMSCGRKGSDSCSAGPLLDVSARTDCGKTALQILVLGLYRVVDLGLAETTAEALTRVCALIDLFCECQTRFSAALSGGGTLPEEKQASSGQAGPVYAEKEERDDSVSGTAAAESSIRSLLNYVGGNSVSVDLEFSVALQVRCGVSLNVLQLCGIGTEEDVEVGAGGSGGYREEVHDLDGLLPVVEHLLAHYGHLLDLDAECQLLWSAAAGAPIANGIVLPAESVLHLFLKRGNAKLALALLQYHAEKMVSRFSISGREKLDVNRADSSGTTALLSLSRIPVAVAVATSTRDEDKGEQEVDTTVVMRLFRTLVDRHNADVRVSARDVYSYGDSVTPLEAFSARVMDGAAFLEVGKAVVDEYFLTFRHVVPPATVVNRGEDELEKSDRRTAAAERWSQEVGVKVNRGAEDETAVDHSTPEGTPEGEREEESGECELLGRALLACMLGLVDETETTAPRGHNRLRNNRRGSPGFDAELEADIEQRVLAFVRYVAEKHSAACSPLQTLELQQELHGATKQALQRFRNWEHGSLLHIAAACGFLSVVRFFVEEVGVDVDAACALPTQFPTFRELERNRHANRPLHAHLRPPVSVVGEGVLVWTSVEEQQRQAEEEAQFACEFWRQIFCSRGGTFATALCEAATNGHEHVVAYLLDSSENGGRGSPDSVISRYGGDVGALVGWVGRVERAFEAAGFGAFLPPGMDEDEADRFVICPGTAFVDCCLVHPQSATMLERLLHPQRERVLRDVLNGVVPLSQSKPVLAERMFGDKNSFEKVMAFLDRVVLVNPTGRHAEVKRFLENEFGKLLERAVPDPEEGESVEDERPVEVVVEKRSQVGERVGRAASTSGGCCARRKK
eukprot:g17378.t1